MAKYETAPYKTLVTDGQFELRAYDAFYTAAVREPNWEDSNGFRQIFNYISGSNKAGEKISMTTPVFNELEQDHASTEFVLPSAFTGKKPPEPENPAIQIKAHQAQLAAVIRFSGKTQPERVRLMEERLRLWIKSNSLRAVGPPRLARYNPPMIPPFLRRNELLLKIVKEGS